MMEDFRFLLIFTCHFTHLWLHVDRIWNREFINASSMYIPTLQLSFCAALLWSVCTRTVLESCGGFCFDANGVRIGYLFLLCKWGPQHASVRLLRTPTCLCALSFCDINVFLSPFFFPFCRNPVCATPIPMLFPGRCYQAYCRNIAVSYLTRTQVRTEQRVPSLLNPQLQDKSRVTHDFNECVVMLRYGQSDEEGRLWSGGVNICLCCVPLQLDGNISHTNCIFLVPLCPNETDVSLWL